MANNFSSSVDSENYKPVYFIEKVKEKAGIRTDYLLAKLCGMNASVVSKIRNKASPISDTVLLRIHVNTGIPINQLLEWMVGA